MMYTPNKPPKYVRKPLVEKQHYARVVDTTPCSRCGWPIKHSAVRDGWTPEGEYIYKHMSCPTTRERAAMRRAALVNE